MRFNAIMIAALALLWAATAANPVSLAQPALAPAIVRLEVTRDSWVSNVGAEADGNNGGAPRLKLKSIQEMTLVDFDLKPLLGQTIRGAVLHLKKAGDEPLRRVTVGGIGAEWFEGAGTGYAVEPGGVTFRHRRHPDLAWSLAGGDLANVVLGNGGTAWRMADAVAPDAGGWQRVPVDPRVVAVGVAGLCHGFLVFDDTGTEWSRSGEAFALHTFPNRFVYSRDQNKASAPYLTVAVGPADRSPPLAPAGARVEPETARMPAGEALVSWLTPEDSGPAGTVGFVATLDGRPLPRALIPLARRPGERVQMHLRDLKLAAGATARLTLKAVDGAGNLGPAASLGAQVSGFRPAPLPVPSPPPAAPRAQPAALPRLGSVAVAIIDELDKVHPTSGALIPDEPAEYLAANHLWNAAGPRITLQAARGEFVAFQVLLTGGAGVERVQIRAEPRFEGESGRWIEHAVGRYHPVATPLGEMPDPIVPPEFPVASSAPASQSLHVELYVRPGTPNGDHRGVLTLRGRAGLHMLEIPITLTVWDFTLPDSLSFLPEMNCYALPENELDYYRLAHRHRTVLNRVPYSQSGRIADGCAPRWHAGRRELDWSDWDRRFGPLLNGSAFHDLPRAGVPLECFYLPLHENWPTPMEGNYNGDLWADRAFPEPYRRAFVAASRQIAAHLNDKHYHDTIFQCFLNNKVDFKVRGWSRGSSPWLLDEPANFQDYWALRYFATAFHEGINQALSPGSPGAGLSSGPAATTAPAPRLVFRADISRPQWRRDALDGLLDYHVVGSAMRAYPRLVFDRKRALGEIVLEYGSTNPVESSNFQPVGWCLDTWSLGCDGVVPWQTIGTADSWAHADELALFYPGRGGNNRTDERAGVIPVPSIRLKAYRRGQQDVEYLALWSSVFDQPRWAVGAQLRRTLKLAGTRQATGAGAVAVEDAGRIDFAQLRPTELWAMRTAIARALSQAHPPPRKKLVDFRTPRRNPDILESAYVEAGARP